MVWKDKQTCKAAHDTWNQCLQGTNSFLHSFQQTWAGLQHPYKRFISCGCSILVQILLGQEAIVNQHCIIIAYVARLILLPLLIITACTKVEAGSCSLDGGWGGQRGVGIQTGLGQHPSPQDVGRLPLHASCIKRETSQQASWHPDLQVSSVRIQEVLDGL